MKKRSEPQTVDSNTRDGFFFLGGQLALDFLNTRPVLQGTEPTELLEDGEACIRWFRAAGLIGAMEAKRLARKAEGGGRPFAGTLQELREQLRGAVFAIEGGGAPSSIFLRRINRLLLAYPMLERVTTAEDGLHTARWFDTSECDHLLAPLVSAIADLLTNVPVVRLRQCEQCVLHFQDSTKNGKRRWCSMRLCGNRHKVSAYAARQRSGRA